MELRDRGIVRLGARTDFFGRCLGRGKDGESCSHLSGHLANPALARRDRAAGPPTRMADLGPSGERASLSGLQAVRRARAAVCRRMARPMGSAGGLADRVFQSKPATYGWAGPRRSSSNGST